MFYTTFKGFSLIYLISCKCPNHHGCSSADYFKCLLFIHFWKKSCIGYLLSWIYSSYFFTFLSVVEGQSVALRLGKQLKRVCGEFRKQVEAYNLLDGPDSPIGPSKVTGTIDNISTEPWWTVDNCVHPDALKRQAVDVVNLIDQCEEEEFMVKAEMCSVLSWYSNQHHILKEKIELEPSTIHPCVRSTLFQEGLYVEYKLASLQELFCHTVSIDVPSVYFRQLVGLPYLNDNEELDCVFQTIDSFEKEALQYDYVEDSSSDEESEEFDQWHCASTLASFSVHSYSLIF